MKDKHPFHVNTKALFRYAPVISGPIPLEFEGVSFNGLSYAPGKASGSATCLGEINNYFNQLAYWAMGKDPHNAPPSGSVAASLTDVADYPVFIPESDFSDVGVLIKRLKIPAEANGHKICSVFVNAKDEAVYATYVGTSYINPVSEQRVEFGGKGKIVGGTGRFADASGEFAYAGNFNPQNQDDAAYDVNGWIKF